MAIKADNDGFLVGKPVELDTRWMERVLGMVGNLAKDMAEVRRILAGQRGATRTGQRSAAVAQAKPSSARPMRVGQPLPDRAKVMPAAVSPQRQARAIAAAVATMAARDAKGRFIGKPGKATQAGSAPAASDPGEPKQPREPKGGSGGNSRFAKLAGEAAKEGGDAAIAGTSQVDPVLGAVKEIGAPLAAVGKVVGGGLFDSWKDRAERKRERRAAKESAKETVKAQIPWFKRIIESRGGGGEAGGGGMLSGLLSMLGIGGGSAIGGGIGGLLARAAGGIKGIFSGGGSKIAGLAKGGLGKALLPIGAIMSAVKSFNVSSEDYAKRYGTEIGGSIGKDMLVRTAGVLQDLVNSLLLGIPQYLGEKIGSAAVTAREAVSNGWNMLTGGKHRRDTKPASSAVPISAGIPGGSGTETAASKKEPMRGTPGGGNAAGRSGGSRAWRNNNPGNIEYGNFAKSLGAVGTDGRFAIFPSEEAGMKAQEKLLFEGKNYRNLTLGQAIKRWAPASENNVHAYISAMGGSSSTRMQDYSPSQRKILLERMRKHEGWKPGRVHGPAETATSIAPKSRSSKPASMPLVPAGSSSSRVSAKPSPAQMALPPPPPEQPRIGSNRRGKDPVQVTLPRELTQNLSDRGIAQLATGGMGGNMVRGVG